MRNILILMIMVFILGNLRAEEKAPAPFQNSDIKRTLEDGKVQKFDGDRYMIVKRKKNKTKPKVIIREKTVYKKNTVKGFVGYGPADLNRRSSNTVDLDRQPFLGVGYQRHLNEEISVEVIGTTNESLMIGGGFSF